MTLPSNLKIKGKDYKPFSREICGNFPSGYRFCDILSVYEDKRNLRMSFDPGDGLARFAKWSMGCMMETRVPEGNEEKFMAGSDDWRF